VGVSDYSRLVTHVRVRSGQLPTSKGVSYLEVKNQLLLNYCMNLCFYLALKASGRRVKDHPVITQLLRTRTLLEKLRPLDQKLRYQVDKLLKIATLGKAAACILSAYVLLLSPCLTVPLTVIRFRLCVNIGVV